MSAPRPNAVALDPARSVVVEACAGSGKTWLLVSRIIRLLLAGAAPGDILAITFTRKAAQEMATRLRSWLYQLATADDEVARQFLRERAVPERDLDALLQRARALYERVLVAEPGITITTFHSWFMQLLTRAPLDAQALGGATLVEQTTPLVDEAWDRFALALQNDPEHPAAVALERLFAQFTLQTARELLKCFLARRADWWAATANDPEGAALSRVLARLRAEFGIEDDADPRAELLARPAVLNEIRDYAALLGRNTPSDMAVAAALVTALADDALLLYDVVARAVLTLDGKPRVKKASKAQRDRLGADGETRFLELHARLAGHVEAVRQALCDREAWRFNETVLTCGVALLDAYQQVKRDALAIDYGDIEWRAYRLLAHGDHADYLQYKLDARYRHILLDEFQDTNPLQWLTLQAWFGAAAAAGSRPTVFLVGDPKQSIYRFRRAEARLFAEARQFLQREFAAAPLAQNETRRCAAPVIDVVNAVFLAEPTYAGYERHGMHTGATPGCVEVWPLIASQRGVDGIEAESSLRNPLLTPLPVDEDRRREQEAQQLVAGLQAIVGRVAVADERRAGALRAARYGDVMLLVRQRTHLEAYERALRHAGIPYVTSRQGGLLETLEARDLTALLAFLVSPFDDLRLAHALRSPIFSCSDEDLMRVAAAAGRTWWERLNRLDAPTPALARARILLARWLAQADALPVHDQLDRIYAEGDVIDRYVAAVPAAQRAAVRANLDAYIQRALEAGAGRYPSLPRFVAQLEELRAAPEQEAPDEGETSGNGDAVRILTVHGAKGLEAPVVWLLDAAAGRRGGGHDALIDWPPGAARPAHFSMKTKREALSRAQRLHQEREDAIGEREDLNLLYVAMTRARQLLVVSGAETRSNGATWYARVQAGVLAAGGRTLADGRVVHGAMPAAGAGTDSARPDGHDEVSAALTTRLAVGARQEDTGNAGTRYGVAFHRVMERLTTGGAVDESLRRMLGLRPAEYATVVDEARRLIGRPELQRYFDATRYGRATNEVPYADATGAVRRIDRLVEFDDEVWVLDYKTGSSELPATLAADYRRQLREYCTAAAALFPEKRVQGMLVFTDGAAVEVKRDS